MLNLMRFVPRMKGLSEGTKYSLPSVVGPAGLCAEPIRANVGLDKQRNRKILLTG